MQISIEGNEATGKTTFAYTAPLPIVGFSFDLGSDRAINGTQYDRWFKDLKIEIVHWTRDMKVGEVDWSGNDITIFELPQPIQLDNEQLVGFIDLWTFFIYYCNKAIEDPEIKTIVVDTMTLARRVKADAYLQELQRNEAKGRKQLIQIEWGHPNDSIRNIFNSAKNRRKNLIAIHHLTDERKDMVGSGGRVEKGVLTGKQIVEGYSPYKFVDMSLRFEATDDGNVQATIGKSGFNLKLKNSTLSNPSWDSLVTSIEMSLGERIVFGHREDK